MRRGKLTRQQLRRHNRQLVLRAIYEGIGNSRAAIAQETGLTKPTVSDLIAEFLDEGLLEEGGRGQSTESGGKRPRLLQFVPESRQVIGISMDVDRIQGILSNLDGHVIAEHYADLATAKGDEVINVLRGVIDGLIAQLDAPLLCLGIGVPGIVNISKGVIRHSAPFGWRNLPLADMLREHYKVPTFIDHNTELIAIAQYAFVSSENVNSLVTIRIDHDVAIGVVFDHGSLHYGSDIGFVRMGGWDGMSGVRTLESLLGWSSISERAGLHRARYLESESTETYLSYLDLRQSIVRGDPAALALRDDLIQYLEQLIIWLIGLLRPDHIALAGDIIDLGSSLLEDTVTRLKEDLDPELIENMSFSLADATTLSARGAVARAVRKELGIL